MTFSPANSTGPFLNTTIVFSEEESQRLYQLTQFATDTANYLNIRDIAIYVNGEELLNGQQFISTNATLDGIISIFVYRKSFNFGAIAAGATLVIPHGIDIIVDCTRIYGTCVTDVPDFRPIPYASATLVTDQISLTPDDTNITIVVGATSPNVTSGKVVLEYLKN